MVHALLRGKLCPVAAAVSNTPLELSTLLRTTPAQRPPGAKLCEEVFSANLDATVRSTFTWG